MQYQVHQSEVGRRKEHQKRPIVLVLCVLTAVHARHCHTGTANRPIPVRLAKKLAGRNRLDDWSCYELPALSYELGWPLGGFQKTRATNLADLNLSRGARPLKSASSHGASLSDFFYSLLGFGASKLCLTQATGTLSGTRPLACLKNQSFGLLGRSKHLVPIQNSRHQLGVLITSENHLYYHSRIVIPSKYPKFSPAISNPRHRRVCGGGL